MGRRHCIQRQYQPVRSERCDRRIRPGRCRPVQTAIDAARAAFPAWSTSGIQARSDALDKVGSEILARKEELGTLLAREEGKTLPEAIGEVSRAGNIFKFSPGNACACQVTTCPRCARACM